MMIRILCIVIAFIVAVWVSRKINLSEDGQHSSRC